MKEVAWMAGGSVGAWLLAVAVLGSGVSREILFGMLAPLVMACATWPLMERTYRASPERLTALMMTGFAGKLIFFGGYVALMIRGVGVRPEPFIASFTGYYIGLYGIEALLLKRLLAGGRPT
jgi:hypothetical protein